MSHIEQCSVVWPVTDAKKRLYQKHKVLETTNVNIRTIKQSITQKKVQSGFSLKSFLSRSLPQR